MRVLPLLRLAKGECVDILPTPGEGEALPVTDPLEVGLRFQKMGAVGLHVVDVDSAEGRKPNDEALVRLLDSISIPVQAGGGVHSLRRIQELRDTGVHRVIVGSMGVLHQDWLREAAKCFPEGLVANLDEKHGNVWVKGRREDSGLKVERVAEAVDAFGLEGLMLTSLNGTRPASLLPLVKRLRTPTMLAARAGSIGDLMEFHEAGVQAAILGPEIYDGSLDFAAVSKYFKEL